MQKLTSLVDILTEDKKKKKKVQSSRLDSALDGSYGTSSDAPLGTYKKAAAARRALIAAHEKPPPPFSSFALHQALGPSSPRRREPLQQAAGPLLVGRHGRRDRSSAKTQAKSQAKEQGSGSEQLWALSGQADGVVDSDDDGRIVKVLVLTPPSSKCRPF